VKQKTAYEMATDWSSDVCSSDLSEEFYGFMNDGGQASITIPLFYMKDFIEYMPDLENKMAIRPMPVFEEDDARTVPMGGTGTVEIGRSSCRERGCAQVADTKQKG